MPTCTKTDPFVTFITNVITYRIANPSETMQDAFTENALIGSQTAYCCPDCNGRYFLGTAERFLQYYETIQTLNCCFNSYATAATSITLFSSIGVSEIESHICCNDFVSCVNSLRNVTTFEFLQLITLGIVENGTIKDNTTLCNLATILDTYNNGDALVYLTEILNLGVVIWCADGNVYGESLVQYLKYAEAIGLTP
jgi:hypothetical protein